ncbi:MAG: DUF308 domain-containing protein [Clostridia bacterium]|nr:DUF308 domain-containing protein [Clostridia bacterium]
MQSVKNQKPSTVGYILFALTFIALGVCFIAFSPQAVDIMCYFVGGVTVLAGAVNAVLTLANKSRGAGFFIKILLCIFSIACGVATIVSKEQALEYIVFAAAFLLIIDSSFKLQTVIRCRSLKLPLWWAIFGLTVACYIGEAFLIKFYAPSFVQGMVGLLGLVLILDGALNALTPILLSAVEREAEKARNQIKIKIQPDQPSQEK